MSRRSGLRDTQLKLLNGAPETLSLQGNYLRISDAVSQVIVEIEGSDTFKLNPGEDVVYPVDEEFSRVVITTLAAVEDVVTVTIGKGVRVGSAKVSGSVAVTNYPVASSMNQSRLTVSSGVAVQILTANATRKYLLVQNNDPAGVLRLRFDGVAATATQGFRIGPGESIEFVGICASGAVSAIMETSTASTLNVEFIEG